jgi:hypothetical protein
MLKKSIGISAAALAFCVVGFAANGCSSSTTVTETADTGTGTGSDSGVKDSGGGGNTDSGPIAPACYDVADAVGLQTASAPVAHQNVCTTQNISDYVTACLTAPDSGSSDPDAAAQACDAFYAAHPACGLCIGGPDSADAGAYPFPVIVPVSQTEVIPNTVGCIAALSSGTDACKLSFTEEQNCEGSACTSCTSDSDFSACTTYADQDTSGCPSFFPVDSTCTTAINAVTSAQQTSCGSGASDFNTAYTAVATILCGP